MATISNLKKLMSDKGVTLDELSDAVGITKQNLCRICTGRIRALRFTTADAICKFFDCDYGDLLSYIPDDEVTENDIVCYKASMDEVYLEEQ